MLFLGLKKKDVDNFSISSQQFKDIKYSYFFKKNPCKNFQKATRKIALFLSKMRYELCVMNRMM